MNDRSAIPRMIAETDSIADAIRVIDEGRVQIALVQRDGRLIGTVTDGDVRRGLMANLAVSEPVAKIMNGTPVTVPEGTSDGAALALMRKLRLHQLPLVDTEMRVTGLKTLDDYVSALETDNIVVLMAGGLGTRLRPLTEDIPKPLIRIGDRPIIETIMRGFASAGFSNFYLSVNHMADMITDYFGDGTSFGLTIQYIHETKKMGTVGALSLLKERPARPFFVMNGDLLTTLDFRQLMSFHEEHDAPVTVCVRDHNVTIPFGVLDVKDGKIEAVREKPVQKFLVNAGIYVFSPRVLDHISEDEVLDMPALLERLIEAGTPPAAFPMREYWIDVGQLSDLQRASDEFSAAFGST